MFFMLALEPVACDESTSLVDFADSQYASHRMLTDSGSFGDNNQSLSGRNKSGKSSST
jgi:hypothetical protein